MQGQVKFYNDQKGFGFIVPEDGGEDLFFHITQCEEGFEPAEGDDVIYELGQGRDGRSAAQQVRGTGTSGSSQQDDEYEEEEEQQEEGQEEQEME